MIKLGKWGIRLSVIPIIEDLFWSSSTVEESLTAHISASEIIILDISATSDGGRQIKMDKLTQASVQAVF
jgi:hypothetical protein